MNNKRIIDIEKEIIKEIWTTVERKILTLPEHKQVKDIVSNSIIDLVWRETRNTIWVEFRTKINYFIIDQIRDSYKNK